MLIKAGTYRFNDVLTFPTENDIEQDVNYTIRLVISALEIDAIATFKNIKISKVDGRPTDVMCWLTDDLATAYDTDAVQIYAEGKWNTAYLDDHIKTLTIAEEQEVSDEFYAWFTANAVEQKEISGVWKWKDELTVPTNEPIYEDVNFTVETSVSGMYEGTAYCNNITIEANFYADELERNALWYNVNELVPAFPYLQTPIALPICEAVHRLGKETLWHSDDFGEGIKTIDFGTEPQSVSAEFYNWLTANATELVDISGKWRFREVLTPPADAFKETVSFLNGGESFNAMYAKTVADTTGFGLEFSSVTASGGEILLAYADGAYGDLFAVSGWADDAYRTVDFGTESQAVSAEFYNWLTGNAVQSNGSLLYRGETIAELFPGQTVTLKCGGMRMEDDVVVRV